MIHVQTIHSPVAAAKQAFMLLYENGKANTSDKSLWKEDISVIELAQPQRKVSSGFAIRNNAFRYNGDYQRYCPHAVSNLVQVEEEDYTDIFLKPGMIEEFVNYFQIYPDSRRQVFNAWRKRCIDPQNVGICITQIYCRLNNGRLELHSHSRANDAFQLLLLDMQLALSIQRELAQAISKPLGRYVHFVDSLHFYKRHKQAINQQKAYMLTSDVWREV